MLSDRREREESPGARRNAATDGLLTTAAWQSSARPTPAHPRATRRVFRGERRETRRPACPGPETACRVAGDRPSGRPITRDRIAARKSAASRCDREGPPP